MNIIISIYFCVVDRDKWQIEEAYNIVAQFLVILGGDN
jgi:hypothetical protein